MLDIGGIVRIFEEIEQRLISSLKRNLMRHKREEKDEGFSWSAWQAEKLRGLERYRRENAAIMSEYADQIDTATREIMEEQFAEGVNGSDIPPAVSVEEAPSEIRAEPQFFGVDRVKVDKLIEDVTAIEKSAETAALRMTDDVYRQTVNRVQLAMATGSMSLQQAIDTAVKDFLDQGINCIVYKDGKRVNIADYVRMVLRTTATRAALQGKSAKYKALGYDTVVTSSYDMCSETCKPWQGRIYIDDTFTGWSGETRMQGDMLWGKSGYCGKWFPLLSEAIKRGLFHPNCRHSINLWRDGDPIPESIDNTDNERRYKLEQQQRALERAVRKAKRRAEGFTDPANIRKAKAEVREAQKALREFINKVNADEGETVLRRDYGKETSYGAAELTEAEKNAIIKQEKAAKEAARRAKEYSGNWTKASLSETVAKFGLDKQSPVSESGKIIFSRDDSNITVVYDTNEDYFRIQDKTIPQHKRSAYFDINGNNAQNIVENGKQRGRTKHEFQRDTHFLNSDTKEEEANDEQ